MPLPSPSPLFIVVHFLLRFFIVIIIKVVFVCCAVIFFATFSCEFSVSFSFSFKYEIKRRQVYSELKVVAHVVVVAAVAAVPNTHAPRLFDVYL